jgi:hypothetical protein
MGDLVLIGLSTIQKKDLLPLIVLRSVHPSLGRRCINLHELLSLLERFANSGMLWLAPKKHLSFLTKKDDREGIPVALQNCHKL